MNRLLILSEDAEKYSTLIKKADLQQLEIRTASDIGPAGELIAGCNIVLGDPPLLAEVLPSTDNLAWMQSAWAGVEQLCRPGLRRDYVLTNAKDIFGPQISEYVMTYLFAFERRVFSMRSNQMNQRWQPLAYRPANRGRRKTATTPEL